MVFRNFKNTHRFIFIGATWEIFPLVSLFPTALLTRKHADLTGLFFFFKIDNVFSATHETGRLKRNHQVARLLWNSRVHECPKLAAITRRNTNVTRLHGHQTRWKRARTSFACECERLPSSVRVPLRRLATHFPVRKQSKCGEGGE